MKKLFCACLTAVLAVFASLATRAADWTYDSSAKTITDGEWTLPVTLKNNELMLDSSKKANIAYSGTTGVLDLSKKCDYPIVNLGSETFLGNTDLVEIVLPDGLTELGKYTFRNATNLKKVTPFLPQSLVKIGQATFTGCTSLEGDLDISRPTTSVAFETSNHVGDTGAFRKTKITSANFTGLSTVPDNTFLDCEELKSVVLSENLVSIGGSAFRNCVNLESVEPFLPSTLATLGSSAFYNCQKLTGALFLSNPDSLILGHYNNGSWRSMFVNAQITAVTITAPVTVGDQSYNLDEYMFDGNTLLGEVSLPGNVTAIPAHSFCNCTSLTNLTFSGDMPTIASTTFRGVPAKSMNIHVPRDNASWSVLESDANFTAVTKTDDNMADFNERYPNYPSKPYGLWKVGETTAWVHRYSVSLPGFKIIVR